MNSQSLQALEGAARKFLSLLQAEAPPLPKKRSKNDVWPAILSRYSMRQTRSPYWPFVLYFRPSYKFLCANGDMHDFVKGSKVRTGFFGNIFALATKEAVVQHLEWKSPDDDGAICGWYSRAASQKCDICTRTKGVRNTIVGYRCQYCRASDSRHIGLIRRLGCVPRHNGRPIVNYLVD